MGTFNTVRGTLACPRCGVVDLFEVEVRLGNTAQITELQLGDRYPWVPDQPPDAGGRPADGNADAEGYMECEHCHKDAFLCVTVRNDVVVRIAPDPGKRGYIADP